MHACYPSTQRADSHLHSNLKSSLGHGRCINQSISCTRLLTVISDHKILDDSKLHILFLFYRFIYFMCLNVYVFMYLCLVPKGQKSFESPGTAVISNRRLPCGSQNRTRSSAKTNALRRRAMSPAPHLFLKI